MPPLTRHEGLVHRLPSAQFNSNIRRRNHRPLRRSYRHSHRHHRRSNSIVASSSLSYPPHSICLSSEHPGEAGQLDCCEDSAGGLDDRGSEWDAKFGDWLAWLDDWLELEERG